jgi:chromosome partitioning protein
MRTLLVGARKGGAGKTTVAVNIALAARLLGLKAVLADVDPLRSSTEVLRGRSDAGDMLAESSAAKLFALAETQRRRGADLLVVDTPAAPENDVAEAAKVADLCLVVSRPTFLDLSGAVRSSQMLLRLQRPALVVLNQCPPARAGQEPPAVLRALEALRVAGVEVAPTPLRSRVAYQTACAAGRGVAELDPRGPASAEVMSLFMTAWKRMSASRPPSLAANDAVLAGPMAGSVKPASKESI